MAKLKSKLYSVVPHSMSKYFKSKKLAALDKLVLYTLLRIANFKTGECKTLRYAISENSGLGVRTITRSLGNLQDLGIITIKYSYKGPMNILIHDLLEFRDKTYKSNASEMHC